VRAFEDEFACDFGADHAVAVSSGTAALELTLYSLGIGNGDEVLTVSHSFIATANAIRRVGAMPVFVDIERETFNIDVAFVDAAIGPRTRAILAVHQMGMPCDLDALAGIAKSRGLILVEDAACAAGSETLKNGHWERIGRPRGAASCFSFHPRKVMTTGDGGMITTNDGALADRMRRLRTHGMDVPADIRHQSGVVLEKYTEPGFNLRMTDIQAAIGRVQLARLSDMLAGRRRVANQYRDRIAELPNVRFPYQPRWARTNWQSICVRLPDGVRQRAVMELMWSRGISTRRGVMNAHREPAYGDGGWVCGRHRDCAPGKCDHLHESEAAQDRCIQLPVWPSMSEAEQDRVVFALHEGCM